MTQVNVLDSDSTDPSKLAEGRDTTIRRDATATPTAARRRAPQQSEFGALSAPSIDDLVNTETTNNTPVVDSPATDASVNPLVPRVYPNIPANIVPPVPLDLSNTMGDQATVDQILRQSGTFALQDDISLNNNLQSLLNSGVPFGPNQPLYQPPDINIPEFPYPQTIEDAIEYRARQSAVNVSPIGINSQTGGMIPGARNALGGNPLSEPVREGLGKAFFGNIGTEFEESLPDNPLFRNPLSIFKFGLAARDVVGGLGSAIQTNQFRRFASRLSPTGIGRAAPQPADRFTGNLGTIASRIVDPTSELAQRPIDTGDEGFVDVLATDSLVVRDLFKGLATTGDNPGVNLLQGQFGDFGNAGVLSGLLYLANLPEGLASGALYELTNFYVDNFTDIELGRDRVRLFDAFRGRDLGFMQEQDDARYLSFIGDNSLLSNIGIRNPVAQGAIGFVTDVIWGGFADFGTNQIARTVTRNIIDPAVARALPEVAPSSIRILNQEGAASVVNLNKVIDDAIEARRLNPLPRITADPSLRRTLPIKADGVTLSTRVSRIGDLVREVFVTRPGNLLDEIRVNRLSQIEEDLVPLQESIIRNNLSSQQARQAIETLGDLDSPITPDLLETQLAIIRNSDSVNEATQRQIRNLIAERRDLALSSGNLRQVVARETQEALARGSIRLDGDRIVTLAPDPVFDELLPTIFQESIQPSIPIKATLRQYRIDPTATNPIQLSPVRRTNEQLTSLAKFHNLVPSNAPILGPRQLQSLRREYPTLLSRYGNPIDDNLSLPVKRIQLSPADPLNQVQGAPGVPSGPRQEVTFIPDVPPPTVGEIQLDPISKRTVNALSRRAERIYKQLESVTDIPTENRLLKQLDAIESRLHRVFANSSSESVEDFYIEALPINRAPTTPASTQIARSLSRAESRFSESAKSARNLQQQLIDAQRVLDEQGSYLEELPELERATLHHEVATRNNYTRGGVPLIAPSEPIDEFVPTATRVIADPPKSLQQHISNGDSWYHGTKSLINDMTAVDFTKGSSVSNELGPGLYLTTDPNLAREFAKAHPVVDRVPNPSLRATDVGRVHQITAAPGPTQRIIDGDSILPKDSPVRSLFHDTARTTLMRSLPDDVANRFINNIRRITRNKPYRDWFQSLRLSWNRIAPDSQTELVAFNSAFTKSLVSDLGVYGASHKHLDGHFTLAVYDNTGLAELNRVPVGTGGLAEQRLSRYAADLFAHNEFNNATTRSNLAASALAVDQQSVNNLKSAVKDAYRRSLDDTENMLRLDTELQNQVRLERSQRIADIQQRGPNSASTQLRRFRGDNNSPCL